MPAKVKYTPAELADAVDSYFKSIKRMAAATELVPTGETARNGQPKMESVPIKGADGEPIMIEKWIIPPTITSLCLNLQISKMTWSEYSKKKGYSEICEYAKEVCREYLERELLTRDRVDGVKFALQFAHGYDRSSTNDTGGVLPSAPMGAQKLSMAEIRDTIKAIRDGEFENGKNGEN